MEWGGFRRTTPLDRSFGFHRGRPVDRYYIESFLSSCAGDIRGDVLEAGSDAYARRFGGARVASCEILSVDAGGGATIVGDLASPALLPEARFDCIVLTQTLQYVASPAAALEHCRRALRPGGVLLLTVPCIAQLSRRWAGHEHWRFTAASMRALAAGFGEARVTTRGNVLTAVALLHGIACEDLSESELQADDPDYPLIVTLRAVRR